MAQKFTVVAGKIEFTNDGECERNVKYVESFDTFEQAFVEWKRGRDYHFNEIEYEDEDGKTYTFS